jgi:uncharacterized protein (TIGR02001 family)
MKKLISFALAGAVLMPTAADAQAVLSATAGFMSQYYYRGILQKESSANAGISLAASGFTAGTWAADVGDGSEVDLFASYAIPAGSGSVTLGGTGYFYTGDFDNTYLEGNVGLGYGPLTMAFAYGTHDVQPSVEYWFLGLTAAYKGFSLIAGHLDYDNDETASGEYVQAGYKVSLSNLLDISVAWVMSDEVLSGMDQVDHTVVLGLGKTFTIR